MDFSGGADCLGAFSAERAPAVLISRFWFVAQRELARGQALFVLSESPPRAATRIAGRQSGRRAEKLSLAPACRNSSFLYRDCSPPKGDYALVTLLDLKQLAHTWSVFGVPFTIAFTVRILGFHCLFDRLWEWLTLMPNCTPFWQISHLAMIAPPLSNNQIHVHHKYNTHILSDSWADCKENF